MGFDAIRKGVILSIKSFFRWVGSYPFILGVVVFFFLLYRFLPFVFSSLLSSSPIFVCTAVLLQALFSFGHPNVHKDEKKEKEKDENSAETRPPFVGRRGRNVADKTKSSGFRSHHTESSVDGPHQHWDPGPSPSITSLDGSFDVSEYSIMSNDGSCEMEDEAGRLEDGVQPVEWTEDDEKNLMELGTSELEKNRRLENLIAKRSAMKLPRMAAQKDLIDFDDNEFPQIPAITTKRDDPLLALSYNPNDASELPPIPCSAPVLLSTRNPFDIPYDPLEEKPNLLEADSFNEEFMAVQQKDVHFCRHESFCSGPSFMGQPKKDIRSINLTPFAVTEQTTPQSVMGGGFPFPSFLEGMSERSDSVVSSAPEAEPLSSSVAYLGEQEKFIEQDLSREGSPISYTGSVPESFEQESQASNEVVNSNSNDIEREENREVRMVEIPGVDKEITHETDSESTTADTHMEAEVARKYEGLNSSRLIEKEEEEEEDDDDENEKIFHVNKDEGLENPSYHIVEGTDCNQREEPLYDSSPSAIDKKTIEENLFYVDKGVILTTSSSVSSDLQVEVSQVDSPSTVLDRASSLVDGDSLVHSDGSIKEELYSSSEGPFDASSHLSDDGNESRSNKVMKSSEVENTRVGLSGDSDDQAAPHVELETVVVGQVSPDSLWNSVAVGEGSINTTLSSSPPMDQVPSATSDPNMLLDEKEKADSVTCNYSDDLSHEGCTHSFKGEVSSGSEVQYGASFHPGGDENELISNKITQSSELETTKAGLSGDSDDPAAPHAVPEPMVVEQVSSHSLPQSVAVEQAQTDTFSSPYRSMDQVALPISDPHIPFDEEKEKPVPLMKEPIVQPPLKEVHEEPRTQFLMEKPSLNGEEPQEQSTVPVNSTEETNIVQSRNEPVVCQDETRGRGETKA